MDMKVNYAAGHYLEVEPGVEIYYEDVGSGEPLVLIPGITMSTEVFCRQVDYFKDKRRVITIDPRSQGRSTKTLIGNTYEQHGKDFNALFEALDLKDITLCGWSTGNHDVWAYIDEFGLERVKQVVCIDMPPKPLSIEPGDWVELTHDEMSEIFLGSLNSAKGQREFFAEYTTSAMLHNYTDEEVAKIVDISSQTPFYILHTLYTNVVLGDYRTAAKTIEDSRPSLMFIAEHWADVAEPYMKNHFPKTKTCVMGGHMMFYEYHEEFNRVLEEFMG